MEVIRAIVEESKKLILKEEDHNVPINMFPHIYRFENKNKQVVFFAANHSANPKEEQFKKITVAFNDLKPSIVFVEGMERFTNDGPEKDTFQENISNDSKWQEIKKRNIENVFTYKLAFDNNIPVISPEYTDDETKAFFKNLGRSEDEIFLFFGSQIAMNYAYQSRTESLESFFNKQMKALYDSQISCYDRFTVLADKIFGDTVDLQTGQGFKAKCSPIPFLKEDGQDWYITNEMSRQFSRKRNEKILEEIATQLELHDKIFVVYGGSHGVILQSAIKYLIAHI